MSDFRRWTAMVLAAVALPLMIMSLIDPLEGSIPLLAAVMLTVIVRLMSRVPIPRLELSGMIASVAMAAVTLIVLATTSASVSASPDRVENPLGGWALALLWVYRAAVLLAVAGAVQYLVRLVRVLLHVPVARAVHR